MSAQLFWLHEEVLSEALSCAQETSGCSFLFVFDTVWLRARAVSLKRIQFIYETLLALPVDVEIVYGDAADVLRQRFEQYPELICKVVAPKDPELSARVENVARLSGVAVVARPRWFAAPANKVSRFFKFYNAVRGEALAAARDPGGEL